MEVVVPVMAPSAPCSPRTAAMAGGDHLPAYCYFFSSAPTSPSRASCAAASPGGDEASTFDFTLGFSGQLQEATPTLAAADELFEGGRIRPLNAPHPSILRVDDAAASSCCSASAGATRRSPRRAGSADRQAEAPPLERGRPGCRPAAAAAAAATSEAAAVASSRSRRGTRSLSPFRGGGGLADDDDESPPPSPRASSMMRGCGSRKWRLKDLFLFRSASEGRATGKDPLFKYTALSSSSSHPHGQPQRLSSASSMRKGRGSAASASDMPYGTTNRAGATEDARRRTSTTTPLPFHRNSLFGYLRSNPAIHSISRKLGGSSHSGSSSSSSRGSRPT